MTVKSPSTVKFLPYGRQTITEDDIKAVRAVLESDWLTQGPAVERFEVALAEYIGAAEVVACATGTAALHLAMLALGLGPGDWIVASANTFLADANAARLVGADVLFADIDPSTGNVSPETVSGLLKRNQDKRIKALLPVHFAGQPVQMQELSDLAGQNDLIIIDDACHALGAEYDIGDQTRKAGAGSNRLMSVFSFHPVKHVTTGEGGAVATDDTDLAERLRLFRCHGMNRENFKSPDLSHALDGTVNPWYYEMQAVGLNYRLTDIQAALGLSQLTRLDESVARRNQLARQYEKLLREKFSPDEVRPLDCLPGRQHAYHLYVLRIEFARLGRSRGEVMRNLRERGIGTQVHYIPIPLQPYYQELYGIGPRDIPGAMSYYESALSIPMYPALTDEDQLRVVSELEHVLRG